MRYVIPLLATLILAGPGNAEPVTGFQSPTGNIRCIFYYYVPDAGDPTHALRCDIIEHTPSFRGPPAGCDLDWRGLFWLEESGAGLRGCAGDVGASPSAPVLGYGEQIREGNIICRMERQGVTCTNSEGHGFFISRAHQRLF